MLAVSRWTEQPATYRLCVLCWPTTVQGTTGDRLPSRRHLPKAGFQSQGLIHSRALSAAGRAPRSEPSESTPSPSDSNSNSDSQIEAILRAPRGSALAEGAVAPVVSSPPRPQRWTRNRSAAASHRTGSCWKGSFGILRLMTRETDVRVLKKAQWLEAGRR